MALPTRRVTPQRPPTRAKSRAIRAAFNSGGIKPIVTVARQKTKPLFKRPQFLALRYNSGGIIPIVIQAKQKTKPLRKAPQITTPLYNSGGISPFKTIAIRQKPPKPQRPQLATPPFNSGGMAPTTRQVRRGARVPPLRSRPILQPLPFGPAVTRAVQKAKILPLRPRIVALPPLALPVGTPPLVLRVPRAKPPLARRPIILTPIFNSGGTRPAINAGIRRNLAALRPASRFQITPAKGVTPPPGPKLELLVELGGGLYWDIVNGTLAIKVA